MYAEDQTQGVILAWQFTEPSVFKALRIKGSQMWVISPDALFLGGL